MKNGYLRVSAFSRMQHYADRAGNPWIKFYVHLLDDEEMNQLPVPTRLLWDRLLLLAQRTGNVIPNDPERVAKLTCIEAEEVREGIRLLLKGRWLKETKSPRRASKRASKPASADTDTEKIHTNPSDQSVSEATPAPALTDITQQRPTSEVPGAQRILDQCDVFDENTSRVIESLCIQLAGRPQAVMLAEQHLQAVDTREIRRSKTALAVRLLQDAVAQIALREIA